MLLNFATVFFAFLGILFPFCTSQAVSTITFAQFSKAVTTNPPEGSQRWPAPSKSKYDNFMKYAKSRGAVADKQEAAMVLANILHESDGLQAVRESKCQKPATRNCPNDYKGHGCEVKGQYYYGRGYIQLSWCYNYRDASAEIFNDKNVLLNKPDRVASEDRLSWETTFWFWKKNVHQEATTGQFGLTIKKINGGKECGSNPENSQGAPRRKNIYVNVRKAFGLKGPGDHSGC